MRSLAYVFGGGVALLIVAGMFVGFLAVVGLLAYAIATSSPSSAPANCPDGLCPPPVQQFSWTTPSLGPEPDYYGPPPGGG